jgi:hypothetical protein
MSSLSKSRAVRAALAAGLVGSIGALLAGCNLGVPAVEYTNVPGQDVAVGDVNGDGHPDAVTVGDPDLAVLLGDGTGALAPRVVDDGVRETCPKAVALADVNGDGRIDVVRNTTCLGGSAAEADVVRWLPGDGEGGFGAPLALPDAGVHHLEIVDLATGDVNGDGAVDVVADYLTGQVAVYLNDGAGTFSLGLVRTIADVWRTLVVDLDRDGDLDLLSAGAKRLPANNALAWIVVQRGTGTGSFGAPEEHLAPDLGFGFPFVQNLTVMDLNRDGRLDVVTTVSGGADENVPVVFPGDAGGGLGVPVQPSWSIDGKVRALEVADIDGDRIDDLVAARDDSGATVLFGDGSGSLGDNHLVGTEVEATRSLAISDLDGNGRPDLVVSGQHCEPIGTGCLPPSVGVLRNTLTSRPSH